ncbi:MAG: Deoxyadenosine kinase [Candidatus Carbobacillus altaicus]|uniref:Deoxyadenosine kinase n=1 Tax=Candidatus Carbonibacillus altaicus TaxID=2163959 RepID=A0A2R6XYL4_9BACL|nr:MAG: Deoxyadenosine kinase [Candidatus Carbobacillus altaicus]
MVRWIAVEGPIGAGKTTLARALADHLGFTCMLENVQEHPFLTQFYENPKRWALHTESFFLIDRYEQLRAYQKDMEESGVVSDYHILKNLIFAEATLDPETYKVYRQMVHTLTSTLPRPAMIVYIRASLPTLLERIKKRGRPFEQAIDPNYLALIAARYEHLFFEGAAPSEWYAEFERPQTIYTIDGDAIDFVADAASLQNLLNTIQERFYALTR